jgi:hypothetical protein
MMAALLTGVNRAFPFTKLDDSVHEKYMNDLFTIRQNGSYIHRPPQSWPCHMSQLSRQANPWLNRLCTQIHGSPATPIFHWLPREGPGIRRVDAPNRQIPPEPPDGPTQVDSSDTSIDFAPNTWVATCCQMAESRVDSSGWRAD